MRTGKAGFATKLVILILFIAVLLALISTWGRLEAARSELEQMTRQVQAQTEINAGLTEDIANSENADRILDIARERLGLVRPDEKVFVDTNH